MSQYRVLRGVRVIEQLNEDSTYPDLYTNIEQNFDTRKRQLATGPVQINNVTYTPFENSGVLQVQAVARNSGSDYQPTIQFSNVQYQPSDLPDNITFKGSDNADHHVLPIDLREHNVKVRCTCLDFYYRFATWNFNDDSLLGDKPPLYQRKTDTRPPVNPARVPGLCKHLVKFVDHLVRTGIVQR